MRLPPLLGCLVLALGACASSPDESASSSSPTTPKQTPEGAPSSCATGPCPAEELFTAKTQLFGVATYGDTVFFSMRNDPALYAIGAAGGPPTPLDTPPSLGANVEEATRHVLTAADGYVYWLLTGFRDAGATHLRTFGRTPVAGGPAETLPLYAPDDEMADPWHRSSFTVAGGGLWFYQSRPSTGDTLSRYDLTSHTTSDFATFPSTFDWTWRDLYATGDSVVFTDYDSIGITSAAASRTTYRTANPNGVPQRPFVVAADADSLYWVGTTSTDGETALVRAPRAPVGARGTSLYFPGPHSRVESIALDTSSLYVLERENEAAELHVLAVPLAGGPGPLLYQGPLDDTIDTNVPYRLFRTTHGLVFHDLTTIRRLPLP